MMANRRVVSVVIPSLGETDFLEKIIAALDLDVDFISEIIVVHSGGKFTADFSRFNRVKIIEREERLYPAQARNLGCKIASGALLAFLDADTLPSERWIGSLVQMHSRNHHTVIVGSVDYHEAGGYWGLANYLSEFGAINPFRVSREIFWHGASCNLLVSKRLFDQLGGFPENFRCSEDVVLFKKLRRSGVKTFFCSEGRVFHKNLPGFFRALRHQYQLGCWAGVREKERVVCFPFILFQYGLWLYRYFAIVLFRGRRMFFHRPALLFVTFPGLLFLLVAWNLGFITKRENWR